MPGFGPYVRFRDWTIQLRDGIDEAVPGYGSKVMIQLFLTYFFYCKALAYSLVIDTWTPFMKNGLGVEAGEVNDLYVVVRSPWAMKPLWAVLSDTIPINGYRKRWNIVWATSLSLFSLICLVFFPVNTPQTAAFYFFLFVLGVAVVDSMTQARYTELMKVCGNSIVSFVWGLLNAGGFLAFYNYLLAWEVIPESFRFKILIALAIPCTAVVLYPATLNWLAESRNADGCKPDLTMIKRNYPIFILSCVTAGVAIGGVVIQLLTDPIVILGVKARWINGLYYTGGAVLILVVSQFCLPKDIALPAVYMFMCKALYLNIGLILQYYYIADDTCFKGIPPGPRFTNEYYQFISGYGGTIASLAGVALFDTYMQTWKVRMAFWLTTFVNAFTTIFDLMVVERWNQSLFGQDPNDPARWADQLFFIFGAQAIDRLLDMLDSLPQTVLIGKLCPKNMEAQVFAILAALSNFGNSVAGVNGSIVAAYLGVKLSPPPQDDPDRGWNCENPKLAWGITALGWCKILATFILPLSTVPFTWCCLPDVRLNEDMLKEEAPVEMNEAGGDAPTSFSQGPPLLKGGELSKSQYSDIFAATSTLTLLSQRTRDVIF